MKKIKKALLVVNLGTPDSPGVQDVRKYLSDFLNDRRVIDLPRIFQKILVNLIIVPFRANKSSKLYKRLWTGRGSPILFFLNSLVEKLQIKLGHEYQVYGAMRYGNPLLGNVLERIKADGCDSVTVFPLYPQYASSTTGSVMQYIMETTGRWQVIPGLKLIDQYYKHPAFINAVTNRIRKCNPETFDHIVFSYHSLPVRHINKLHPGINLSQCKCDSAMPEYGRHCYRAACFETSRLLADKMNLPENFFTTSFQSRLSRNWTMPFTDATLSELARKGYKKVLVAAPSFVADCLETRVEIAEDYKNLFTGAGGQELVLAESLNDHDDWIEAIIQIVRDQF